MKVYMVYMTTVMDGTVTVAFENLLSIFSTKAQAVDYIAVCKEIDILSNSLRRAKITYRIVTEKVVTDYVRPTSCP